eukprot:TRINITY_DN2380_c0_g1_i1.p1 TRINITY_DN2380_c0_g1~~TRINITY_DN2380_c0_g1_i1.p1  ORF type:complete len:130 (+),score=41.00 TRINITY_DN2380_c0_g1_i1:251-640(+)
MALTSCEEEEKKDFIFNFERKISYPEIIITQCEKQMEMTSEMEVNKRPKAKRKMLFADFNEKHTERKKLIEQFKIREQQLKEVSMDKYPLQWARKEYRKSVFYEKSKMTTSNEESAEQTQLNIFYSDQF